MKRFGGLCVLSSAIALALVACGGGDSADSAPEFTLDATVGEAFEAEGVTGSFVLFVQDDEPPLVHDVKLLRRDLAPAETFKLFMTLVALETDVLESLDTELTWDGEGPEVPPWNRVHSLRSALETESDWFYAQVADMIGLDPLEVWIDRNGYGNANVRGSRASFWSDGTLLVDTMQQGRFYADLFSDQPTFDRYAAFDVKDLMYRETTEGWTLTWFTGTDDVTLDSDVGWMVGALTTDDATWPFAMTVDLPPDAGLDLDLRRRLAMRVFEGQGFLATGEGVDTG